VLRRRPERWPAMAGVVPSRSAPAFAGAREGLDGKTRPAAGAGGRVGVGVLESGAAEAFDEVDDRAPDEIQRDRVDDQGDAPFFRRRVVRLDRIGEAELVLEAGAAATVHREAEDGRLGLPRRYCRNACRRRWREADVAHARKIGAATRENQPRLRTRPLFNLRDTLSKVNR